MAARDDASPKFQTVLYDKKGPICYITLNRPEKLNAATDQLVEDVNDALFEFDADPDLHVAILSGAGRAFCSRRRRAAAAAPHPRGDAPAGRPAGRRSRDNNLGEAINWKPVIAAVHGYALGLGYSLSQSCDLVVAAEGTQFQIREVQRGLGGAQHWVATWFWTGSRFANEVALTGRMFDAEEALQHGMLNRVVPQAAAHGRGGSARRRDPEQSTARGARQRARHALVRQRDAAPIQDVHAGTRAPSHGRLPRVGEGLRREA